MERRAERLRSMIRVDHAGEYGAKRIYEGQLRVLSDLSVKQKVQKMYENELVHLDYFEKQLKERSIRRSILIPFWHYFSWGLGALSALLGSEYAMLCTTVVEGVIDEHYSDQLEELKKSDPNEKNLIDTIQRFRQDELDHKDVASSYEPQKGPTYYIFSALVKFTVRTAIAFSKRV